MRRLAALVVLGTAILSSGCANDIVAAAMRYGIEDAPEGKRLLWPQPPEVPRYMFAGQLTGEANFVRPDGGDHALAISCVGSRGSFRARRSPWCCSGPSPDWSTRRAGCW